MSAAVRISAAVGMSLALHGGAFAVIDRMPRGWQVGDLSPGAFGTGALQARLRATLSPQRVVEEKTPRPAKPVTVAKRAAAVETPRPAFGALAPPLYLPAEELDEKPLVRTHVAPEFPAGAPVSSGRVVLRLFIAETGNVDEIAILSAEPGKVFEQAAVRAFAGALFTPGRKHGAPVKSALTFELMFGAPAPVALQKAPEGALWQPVRRARSNVSLRKETP